MRISIKEEVKKSSGYLWGAGIAGIFCIAVSKNPLFLLAVLVSVHTLIFGCLLLLRRKLDKQLHDE